MKRLIFWSLIALTILVVVGLFKNKSELENRDSTLNNQSTDVIQPYLLGVSGYVPPHFPTPSPTETFNYWQELDEYAQIYGIHVDWKSIDTIDALASQTSLPVELVLGFQRPEEWVSEIDALKVNIAQILNKHKHIKYLAIGNEINLLKTKYPNEFQYFIFMLKDISLYIKKTYPDVKFFVTFHYDSLRGKAFLMSKASDNKAQMDLIDKIEPYVDVIGFTVFPFMEYKTPDDIPEGYLTELSKYISKPIVITETAWPTQSKFSAKNKALSDAGYAWNESQQVGYYELLREKAGMLRDIEFINTIYLNDLRNYKQISAKEQPLFDSLGIRYNDGSEKPASEKWKNWLNELSVTP
ncbi:hypothetical protein IT417_00075 [bacterium]|nr:hypothetical protein [bacterium]